MERGGDDGVSLLCRGVSRTDRRFVFSTEHGTDNSAIAMYTTAVFYYERPTDVVSIARFVLDDEEALRRFEYRAPGSRSVSVESDFLAPGAAVETRTGREAEDRVSFVFTLQRRYRGLRLRRLFDQAKIQRAEVRVNGQLLGDWAHSDPNPFHRFAEADLTIPSELVGSDGRVQVELRRLSSSWVSLAYELFGEPIVE